MTSISSCSHSCTKIMSSCSETTENGSLELCCCAWIGTASSHRCSNFRCSPCRLERFPSGFESLWYCSESSFVGFEISQGSRCRLSFGSQILLGGRSCSLQRRSLNYCCLLGSLAGFDCFYDLLCESSVQMIACLTTLYLTRLRIWSLILWNS